ncbi:MAG: hypothetical protein LQ342_001186 [Letrouitia transgressa]|nr:MAG: hypothetical protein LQ342_001186 [Letrouitia transgressa]
MDKNVSPWNILRQDEEQRAEIFQDVERCMPENLYFREPPTQAMLLDILFIFCKLNRDVGYRQGMHEVLAPMLWVVSRDAIELEDIENKGEAQSPDPDLIDTCFDSRYVEHDTFTLFCIIMQTAKSFYELGLSNQTMPQANSNDSPIVERSRRVHDIYLQQADPELAEHLTAIEILPQIFLIRWIRLLFGREFLFDDVLSVWDALFAEDATLDLVDLVCVSMLIRIRSLLLDADYSEALTLLLRYPPPSPPNGPSTFVQDALFLRQHLMQDGGSQIIAKYSTTYPADGAAKHPRTRKSKRLTPNRVTDSRRSISPRISAAKFLQDQGGIEGIIQGAAKGVYSRGKKWGVNRALRSAVQGLQSGDYSPKRTLDGTRWSLDDGKAVGDDPAKLCARIKALEQRNKALAKLLENAMEDLWVQQRQLEKKTEKDETTANALSLAIAKIQFVQVYLENPTMPFGIDSTDTNDHHKDEAHETTHNGKQAPEAEDYESLSTSKAITPNPQQEGVRSMQSSSKPKLPNPHHNPSPGHHSRPSLAQSSFSWILGEDQRKSDFVAASPFSSEKKAAKTKAAYLFGADQTNDDASPARTGKPEENDEDEEVIKMGVLKISEAESGN